MRLRRLKIFQILFPIGDDAQESLERFITIGALRACASSRDLDAAKHIHWQQIDRLMDDLHASNTLVSVYAKCKSMADARSVFDAMANRNAVSWNSLIAGYVDNGMEHLALESFSWMRSSGFEPDGRSLLAAIKACSSLAAAVEEDDGRKEVCPEIMNFASAVHSQARARRFDSEDVFVASALVDFYAKCGRMAQARQVFDKITHPNVVSWTTLINGYADSGDGELALEAFGRMLLSGCQADSRAFVAVLMACSILATKGRAPAKQNGGKNIKEKCLQRGVAIHSLVEERHCGSDPFVASTLVDMYTNCGSLDDARNVFDKMPSHGVVSWTALVMGYAENGSGEIALELFSRMIFEGCDPNPRTYVAALVACGSLAALQTGKQLVHALVCKAGVESEVYVANSLVNFYGTCGSMGDAEQVFDSVKNKTVFTWSAMIEGYSHQGDARHVFATFWKMKDEGQGILPGNAASPQD
ncbi:pentatricopeptide repeat-containing protein At4g18520, chloroplastic isoform X1 [Selaginella moellendorffii]|uniref:pentatricopeptide repeat-containing protein At4g18520, chloroplastic isoform X1 n=1 Tax=Selaginella moellendorffii TaxID=88036 RepID=UPI000D1C976B|nr:pentatricopeptide repeat-containing protein At4g18520, chloroplastic isoform X1 [Selaginella moellendorffii]|eukprot:XP_024538081.1 pentatricopeptide repeat-containing protein At4g18520, chloroplastic isoform X1 [Selaginella moellendorffii]